MELVECYSDSDRNGVFKISSLNQQFVIRQANAAGNSTTQTFDLSGLTLEDAEET